MFNRARNSERVLELLVPMAQVYAARYLAEAVASVSRDLGKSYVARFKPIHPTVLIFHCTFVCDARCEMCNNWMRGGPQVRPDAR